MASHLNNRYPGKKMMFEVWNEPNGGFWTPGPPGDETNSTIQQETYFQLYKVANMPQSATICRCDVRMSLSDSRDVADCGETQETADALHKVSSADFQVGGPATAGCPGWTSDLIKFADSTNTPIDFVSCHNYVSTQATSTAACDLMPPF